MTRDPIRAIPAAFTTLYQPNYMDILPVFIWSMAAMPAFAWLERRIGAIALAAPVGLYVAAWSFHVAPPSLGAGTPIGFNPLAWQILFMLGVFLGRRMLLHGRTVEPSRWLTAGAALVLAVGLVLRLSWFGALPFDLGIPESDWIIGKDALAPPRVIHALALAYIVARLVPREAGWMRTMLARWLAAAGRQSLQVFCLGLFLSWMVTAAFRFWPHQMAWLDAPLIVAGCGLLLWFGVWRDRDRDGGRAVSGSGQTSTAGQPA